MPKLELPSIRKFGSKFKDVVERGAEYASKKLKPKSKSEPSSSKINQDLENIIHRRIFTNKSNFTNPETRKRVLKDIPFDEILKYGRENNIFPREILDESQENKVKDKIKSHQKNTGIYLWALGYNPEKCLGVGANGVVWKCGDKAVKVTCNNKKFGLINIHAVEDEKNDVSKLREIMETKEARDSLVGSTYGPEQEKNINGNKVGVFESELAAKGDMEHYKFESKGYKKFLDILDCAINVLKGLQILHANGYSHNDIKPENLLAISNKSQFAVNSAKRSNNSDDSITFKIADFGAMTKIDNTIKIFANKDFYAPDVYKLSKEAVDKRDVYSFGAVLVYLITECTPTQSKNLAKKLDQCSNLENFCILGSNRNLLPEYGCVSENQKRKFLEFLKVVQKMVAPNYTNRIDVKSAYQFMRNISFMAD